MRFLAVTSVLIATAAIPLAAVAQEPAPSPQDQKRDRPGAFSELNVEVHEWFDEERRDGATYGCQPYPLDLTHPGGRFSLFTDCHWLKRAKAVPAVPAGDDQEEQEPEKPLYPVPTASSSDFFRDTGAGAKLQFVSSLGLPSIGAVSPTDGTGVTFDSIDVGRMPGAFLSTTVGVGNLDVIVFADYITGRFTSSQTTTSSFIRPGRIQGPPIRVTTTDTWDLSGTLSLMEIGVAPVLKRFATDDGVFRADIAVSGGFYWGRMASMSVDRTGSVTESFSVPDQNLVGFFGGPTAHATLRISGSWRVGAFGELWWLFGDAKGWTGLAGAELRLDF